MRVLFVNRMLSMIRGGGETFDLEMGRHLAKLGCKVTYLSGVPVLGKNRLEVKWTNEGRSLSPEGRPKSFTLRSPYTAWFPWDKVRGGWRLRYADFWIFERLAARWAFHRRNEFDVVQICQLGEFARVWKKCGSPLPLVMRLTGPQHSFDRETLNAPSKVFASGTTYQFVIKQGRPDAVQINNAVDAQHFSPGLSTWRANHGIPEHGFLLLYVARFQAFKNHGMLIEAFENVLPEVPNAHLILVGSGHLEQRIKQQVNVSGTEGLPSRVHFLGEVPYETLPEIYRAADLKVISSDHESFCFAALEAMAVGLPLVSTDCGWVPVLISGGQPAHTNRAAGQPDSEAEGSIIKTPGGLVVPQRDPMALSRAIVDCYHRKEMTKKMGFWNRNRVTSHHMWENSAAKLLNVYMEVSGSER